MSTMKKNMTKGLSAALTGLLAFGLSVPSAGALTKAQVHSWVGHYGSDVTQLTSDLHTLNSAIIAQTQVNVAVFGAKVVQVTWALSHAPTLPGYSAKKWDAMLTTMINYGTDSVLTEVTSGQQCSVTTWKTCEQHMTTQWTAVVHYMTGLMNKYYPATG